MEEDAALDLLTHFTIEPIGTLTQASNVTVLVDLKDEDGQASGHRAVYKPARGERPLHDFPDGSLAKREVAAYLLSKVGGFDIVPPTVLRDGPFGIGSVQFWVEQEPERLADSSAGLVDVFPADQVPAGWLVVVSGQDEGGDPIVIAHANDPRLRSMAVLDVVLNNADRKGAHMTIDLEGHLRGFDHGLSLHTDDKLRSVLWGWAGEPLTQQDRESVSQVLEAIDTLTPLAELLSPAELVALKGRCTSVLETDALPLPPQGRQPLPWPLW